MRLLKLGTIKIPDIVVCDTQAEAKQCRNKFVPYIIRPEGMDDEQLAKCVLYRFLRRKFPKIDWTMLGYVQNVNVNVPTKVDVGVYERTNDGVDTGGTSEDMEVTDGGYRTVVEGADGTGFETAVERVNVDDFVSRTTGWDVDIEQLQQLNVLPTFLSDITDAIKRNMQAVSWSDGWNKKLDCNIGTFQGSDEAPNLMILDVSGSIPRGVAYTMVTLIDTLRSQANADLIITSRRSQLWKSGEPLPNVTQLNHMIGGCNERKQFYKILEDYVYGKHWGNVIVFGDNDAPSDRRLNPQFKWCGENGHTEDPEGMPDYAKAQRTKVDNLLCFHTYSDQVPGYGLWVEQVCGPVNKSINTDWCRWFK